MVIGCGFIVVVGIEDVDNIEEVEGEICVLYVRNRIIAATNTPAIIKIEIIFKMLEFLLFSFIVAPRIKQLFDLQARH